MVSTSARERHPDRIIDLDNNMVYVQRPDTTSIHTFGSRSRSNITPDDINGEITDNMTDNSIIGSQR